MTEEPMMVDLHKDPVQQEMRVLGYVRDAEEQKKHLASRAKKLAKRQREGRGSYVLRGDAVKREDRNEAPGDVVVGRDFRSVYYIHTDGSRRIVADPELAKKCVGKVKEILLMRAAGIVPEAPAAVAEVPIAAA